ncbi:AzlD domain-containing protein [Nocardia otitidiscaviarum]|uniref:AzlD domain-containing protein n=1 Tax=Nocardia otitidiscaviarum TaxID=1823 RepID=A0A378YMX0_9NOCA|nr:AzlD domain-containing protein [Nocardia otitidiscaviarum]MBF6133129.1 AzlD domain-containing protein [Nocardia otitidiscaviarum]MBF6486525.1 AzlD domain-containing protein [Nocardia otitidiscaviarum]MCP9620332.1 AzlD domain-containing protein [Nocardia otitidiscaviarum]QDP81183.1 AzlD domain-containing protein [Nocardia otitidiscaviarum]SUA78108.1 Predicted membrane protein [Nocardia otitidiscaviarum]
MTKALLFGTLALAVGTYAFRFAGPVLRRRVNVSPRVIRLLEIASVVLLTALAVTTLIPSSGSAHAGIALPAGVLVAIVLAWRRAPLLVVILSAAVTTAVLRLLGVS